VYFIALAVSSWWKKIRKLTDKAGEKFTIIVISLAKYDFSTLL